jgi:hypothetical protein
MSHANILSHSKNPIEQLLDLWTHMKPYNFNDRFNHHYVDG